MTAQVPATQSQPKPQIVAGAPVAALVPQTLDEAFRVAQAIAVSGMAPRGLEKPEQIMVAIMAGAELGFAPFQSLQSFAVVNGRPTLWGDGLVAVVRRNGCTIREWHEGDTAFCEVQRPDTGETIQRSFSQDDAVKAGLAGKTGPWQQYPQRMRAMRARAWAVRDGCADMLRGFQVAEEVVDYQEVREVRSGAAPTGMRARLEARQTGGQGFDADHIARETGQATATTPADDGQAHDSDTGEIIDAEVEDVADDFPGDRKPQQAAQDAPPAIEGVGPASQVLTTVKARKELFEAHVKKAETSADLIAIREHAKTKSLMDDIDAGDAEEVGTSADLTKWLNDLIDDRIQAEREAAKGGDQ